MTTLAVPETWSDLDLINRYKGALKWPRSTDAMVQSRSFEQSIIDNMAAELKRRGISATFARNARARMLAEFQTAIVAEAADTNTNARTYDNARIRNHRR